MPADFGDAANGDDNAPCAANQIYLHDEDYFVHVQQDTFKCSPLKVDISYQVNAIPIKATKGWQRFITYGGRNEFVRKFMNTMTPSKVRLGLPITHPLIADAIEMSQYLEMCAFNFSKSKKEYYDQIRTTIKYIQDELDDQRKQKFEQQQFQEDQEEQPAPRIQAVLMAVPNQMPNAHAAENAPSRDEELYQQPQRPNGLQLPIPNIGPQGEVIAFNGRNEQQFAHNRHQQQPQRGHHEGEIVMPKRLRGPRSALPNRADASANHAPRAESGGMMNNNVQVNPPQMNQPRCPQENYVDPFQQGGMAENQQQWKPSPPDYFGRPWHPFNTGHDAGRYLIPDGIYNAINANALGYPTYSEREQNANFLQPIPPAMSQQQVANNQNPLLQNDGVKQALELLLQALQSPDTSEQHQKIQEILKPFPDLMAVFMERVNKQICQKQQQQAVQLPVPAMGQPQMLFEETGPSMHAGPALQAVHFNAPIGMTNGPMMMDLEPIRGPQPEPYLQQQFGQQGTGGMGINYGPQIVSPQQAQQQQPNQQAQSQYVFEQLKQSLKRAENHSFQSNNSQTQQFVEDLQPMNISASAIPTAQTNNGADRAAKADAKKIKFIQEMMMIILHTFECEKATATLQCGSYRCKTMRSVLNHAKKCQLGGACTVTYCGSTRKIIMHWNHCIRNDCPICSPIKLAKNATATATSTTATATANARDKIEVARRTTGIIKKANADSTKQ